MFLGGRFCECVRGFGYCWVCRVVSCGVRGGVRPRFVGAMLGGAFDGQGMKAVGYCLALRVDLGAGSVSFCWLVWCGREELLGLAVGSELWVGLVGQCLY